MGMRGTLKINGGVADEEHEVLFARRRVVFQGAEDGFQAVFGEQNFQEVDAGEGGGVAKNLARPGQRFFVREQHAVHLPERRDGHAVEDVVTPGEEDFRDADEGGVEFIASEPGREPGRSGEENLVLQAAGEGGGVQIVDGADARRGGVGCHFNVGKMRIAFDPF